MALALTTKLEAINTMLSNVGEAPVNSLTGSLTADVRLAQNILDEVSREVQSTGWHFNTEKEVPLAPNSTNEIELSDGVARVDLEGKHADSDFDVVVRGNKLYNRKKRTYTFTETKKYTVTYMLDWDQLPESARRYIMIRSARIYQDRLIGSEKLSAFSRTDEQSALFSLRDYEMETADYSLFDNWDVARIIDRGSPINRMDRG
ncbi:MAG: putative tail tubular protein [Prokaryotic dsDNA virus sp.]|nr:MAG: putative tail tubular protein [Prokaryotic dsDNA virus sp.]|tara:strand:+ start:213 stop:824 length:612 start_codon:yes stop_codon:yes gene_type:complete